MDSDDEGNDSDEASLPKKKTNATTRARGRSRAVRDAVSYEEKSETESEASDAGEESDYEEAAPKKKAPAKKAATKKTATKKKVGKIESESEASDADDESDYEDANPKKRTKAKTNMEKNASTGKKQSRSAKFEVLEVTHKDSPNVISNFTQKYAKEVPTSRKTNAVTPKGEFGNVEGRERKSSVKFQEEIDHANLDWRVSGAIDY